MAMMDISDILRCARTDAGLSRRKLSELTGYSANSILNWELGRFTPNYYAIQDILSVCGLELVVERKENLNEY